MDKKNRCFRSLLILSAVAICFNVLSYVQVAAQDKEPLKQEQVEVKELFEDVTSKLPQEEKEAKEESIEPIAKNIFRNKITSYSAAVGSTFTVDGLVYKVLSEDIDANTGIVQLGNLDITLDRQSSDTVTKCAAFEGNDTSKFSGVLTIPKNVVYDGVSYEVQHVSDNAFRYANVSSVVLPDSIVTIGGRAFQNSKVTTFTMPDTVVKAGHDLFAGSLITNVNLSKNLSQLKPGTFNGCQKLVEITIPDSIESITGSFTNSNSLVTVNFGVDSKLTVLGSYAFSNCYVLENITLPDGLTTLGEGAFEGASMKRVKVPEGVREIGAGAFYYCSKLVDVQLPSQLTKIGQEAFTGTAVGSIVLPDTVDTIGKGAFANCKSLVTIAIPSGVTRIEPMTFESCPKLELVVLPENIDFIGEAAFNQDALIFMNLPNAITTVEKNAFNAQKRNVYAIENNGDYRVDFVKLNNSFDASRIENFNPLVSGGSYNNADDFVSFGNVSPLNQKFSYDYRTLVGSASADTVMNVTITVTAIKKAVNVTFVESASVSDTKEYIVGESYGNLPSLSKPGHDFLGWSTVAGDKNAMIDSNTVVSKVVDYSLYPIFEAKTYTVSFDTHGGSAVADQSIDYEGLVSKPSDPTRTGYVFAGWYEDAAYTKQWDFATDKVTSDTTIHAKWNIETYTVSFDTHGGSAIADQSIDYEGLVSKPSDPTRTGYVFAGWYEDAAYTKQWDFAADKVTSDTTIHAKWNVETYTVSFDSNGGSAVADQNVDYEGLVSKPTNPTKVGHTLVGWYKDAGLTQVWDFEQDTVRASMNLYAKWKVNEYVAVFDGNGGTNGVNIKVEYNTALGILPTSTREGYTFVGWFTEKIGGTQVSEATTMPVNGATYYAQWIAKQYTAIFDSNGGVEAQQTLTKGCDEKLASLPMATRPGYTFVGWFTEKTGGTQISETTTMPVNGATYYAHWTAKQYTATFDSNGGVEAQQTITKDYGNALGTLPTVTRPGYAFVGWYTAVTGGNLIDETLTMPLDGATYYAQWVKSGDLVIDIEKEGSIGIPATNEEIRDNVLTEQEKLANLAGTKVSIKIVAKQITKVNNEQIENALKGRIAGAYFDISIYKKIGDQAEEKVSILNKPMQFVIDIPKELYPKKGVTRIFEVLREHDGKVEYLKDLDNEDKTVTIQTDRFSTYVLCYKDVVSGNNTTLIKPNSPATGDQTKQMGYIGLFVISSGLIVFGFKKKKGIHQKEN